MSEASTRFLDGEESIIQQYLAPLAAGFAGALGLKDDCAVLAPAPGHEIVLKTDPVAEGIHFLHDDDPSDIGWKALAVNVSDLAAKGAEPRAYLMALSFPEAPGHEWLARFSAGLAEAQRAFGIHLAGGDTDRRPGPITISITVLGEVPQGRMVQRATAKAGDRLYVTGQLGEAALGLKMRLDPELAARWGLGEAQRQAAIRRYLRPQPRLGLGDVLRTYAGAAMDLSDGLAKDLGRMTRASGCGALVRLGDLPVSPAGRTVLGCEATAWDLIAASGDDYELLIAVPESAAAAFEVAVNRVGCGCTPAFGVTHVGEMVAGAEVTLQRPDGTVFTPKRAGWDHF